MRLRILFINHITARGGGEIVLLKTIRQLDKERFDIVVALPSDQGMVPEELAKIPKVRVRVVASDATLIRASRFDAFTTLLRHPGVILAVFATVKQYVQVIRAEAVDLVFTNTVKSDYYGALAAWFTRRPSVWYMHDFVDQHYFPGWVRGSLVLFANLFATTIFCNSNATRMSLIKAGVSGKKLETIYPPAIDGSQPREPVHIRTELAVSPTTRLVTMVGRITRPKGQVEFVRAAKLVLAIRRDVVFLIVGDSVAGSYDDAYKAELEQEVRALNDPRIRMLGMRHDVLGIVAESDSVVFPSLWPEGFGLAVAEAMELGRPVIATTTGGTAEMIEDGVTGLRVAPYDVAGLSRAICHLLDHPEQAQQLGAAGHQHIRHLLSSQNIDQLQQTLERIGLAR